MKQTFLDHKIEVIVFLVIGILITILGLVRVDYTLTSPAVNNDVSNFIEIESEYESDGSFHTTSVFVIRKMTSLQYIVGKYVNTVNVRENPEYYDNVDLDDLTLMGYLSKDDSLANSLVVGITNAQKEIVYESFDTVYLTYTILEKDTLQLRDKVISVDGKEPSVGVEEAVCGEESEFIILRDDEQFTFNILYKEQEDGSCIFGFTMRKLTEIISSEVAYKIVEDSTGGSSGGLMQSLYIFNQLTEKDYSLGLKIAGTGTINVLGEVGPIGGIEQKIITAHHNGIDIFFVPHLSDSEHDNYIKALAVFETLNTNMKLVPVTTFADALAYLQARVVD